MSNIQNSTIIINYLKYSFLILKYQNTQFESLLKKRKTLLFIHYEIYIHSFTPVYCEHTTYKYNSTFA